VEDVADRIAGCVGEAVGEGDFATAHVAGGPELADFVYGGRDVEDAEYEVGEGGFGGIFGDDDARSVCYRPEGGEGGGGQGEEGEEGEHGEAFLIRQQGKHLSSVCCGRVLSVADLKISVAFVDWGVKLWFRVKTGGKRLEIGGIWSMLREKG
jgi:hypothetical protein